MLPLFDTFKKELLDKEVDALDISSMQTSVITKYFKQLGTTKTWDVGIQSSLPINKNDPSEGFITLDRTFQDLVFENDAYDFDFVKTNADGAEFYTPTNAEQDRLDNNPSYLSKFNYWLVVQCMTVKEWFSNNSEDLQNFNCWEYKEHLYQQEIYFKHKLTGTYSWQRDLLEGDTQTITTGATQTSPGVTTTICDIGAGSTNATFDENNVKITTGTSATFETEELGCKKWASLEVPFIHTVNAGNALGAVVRTNNDSNLNIKVYLKPAEDSDEKIEVSKGSFEDPIQLVNQYLEIVVENPGKNVLKNIYVDFYGEEFYRIQLPFKYDEDTDYIMHDEESLANTDKFHPPRKQKVDMEGTLLSDDEGNPIYSTPLFDTNFRLNKEFTPLKNFGTRFN